MADEKEKKKARKKWKKQARRSMKDAEAAGELKDHGRPTVSGGLPTLGKRRK
jgi:hypothetical protein